MPQSPAKQKKFTVALDEPCRVELVLGNQAIARGMVEAGVQVAAGYPGTPSSEILESLASAARDIGAYVQWSTNEKVATEVAAAASMAGLRSAAIMKAQGLNVALDFVMHLNLIGVDKGGLVIVVCDDPGALSGVNEQDSRWLVHMGQFPLLEPSSVQEAQHMAKWAFQLSEELGTAVFLRSVTRISHASGHITLGSIDRQDRRAFFDVSRPFSPSPVPQKHQELLDKREGAKEIFQSSPFNRYQGPASPRLTLVCSGTGGLYAGDALCNLGLQDQVGVMQLGTTWPLPLDFIRQHLVPGQEVLVVEEVDPFLEVNLKEGLYGKWERGEQPIIYGKNTGHISPVGELNPQKVTNAVAAILGLDYESRDRAYDQKARQYSARMNLPRPPVYCPGCPHRASLWTVKNVLRLKGGDNFVTGDIGCYGLDRHYGGQMVTKTQSAMGGGSGLASGFGKLGQFGFSQTVIASCGDSTFFHSALPALINAVHHKADAIFLILDNSATGMTGFQPHPGINKGAMAEELAPLDIEKICRALDCLVEVADPFDMPGAQAKLWDLADQPGAKVMVMRRKCGLLVFRQEGPQFRVQVDQEKCVGEACGCNRYCTRIFKCPALIWDQDMGKAKVDDAMCTGCGFCTNVCVQGAIMREKIR